MLNELAYLAYTGKDLLQSLTFVTQCCEALVDAMKLLELPLPRPRIFDLTDAGPRVGITNHEVYSGSHSNFLLATTTTFEYTSLLAIAVKRRWNVCRVA